MATNLSFKQLFLLDGIGAAVTALLLSQVLARYQSVFGMPQSVLWVLAATAGGFAVYSLLCHRLVNKHWKRYLGGIALANTGYCIITLGLIGYWFEKLTYLGVAYFVGEIILIMILVGLEFRCIRTEEGTV